MKFKKLISVIFFAQAFGFIIIVMLLMISATGDIDSLIDGLKNLVLFKIILAFLAVLFFIASGFSGVLSGKIDQLTDIDTQNEELEKEKEKYQQATNEFVKTFKVKSVNLL